ncbi:RHS repeat-associated core domain-containing protein [Priestia megaterium]|uniref:RHS repeat-associated core domain-containing protein n=1 Tax=Priestia megaterium TaxID=1404 RepID=UPI003D045A62
MSKEIKRWGLTSFIMFLLMIIMPMYVHAEETITLKPGESLQISGSASVNVKDHHDYALYDGKEAKSYGSTYGTNYSIGTNEHLVIHNTSTATQTISTSSNSFKKIDKPALKRIKLNKGDNWEYTGDSDLRIPGYHDTAYYNKDGTAYSYGTEWNDRYTNMPSSEVKRVVLTMTEDQEVYGPYETFKVPKSTDKPAIKRVKLNKGDNWEYAGDSDFRISGYHDTAYYNKDGTAYSYGTEWNDRYRNMPSSEVKRVVLTMTEDQEVYGAYETFKVPKSTDKPAIKRVKLNKGDSWEYAGDSDFRISGYHDTAYYNKDGTAYSYGTEWNDRYRNMPSSEVKRVVLTMTEDQEVYGAYETFKVPKSTDKPAIKRVKLNKGDSWEYAGDSDFRIPGYHDTAYYNKDGTAYSYGTEWNDRYRNMPSSEVKRVVLTMTEDQEVYGAYETFKTPPKKKEPALARLVLKPGESKRFEMNGISFTMHGKHEYTWYTSKGIEEKGIESWEQRYNVKDKKLLIKNIDSEERELLGPYELFPNIKPPSLSGEEAKKNIIKQNNSLGSKNSKTLHADPIDTSSGAHLLERSMIKVNGARPIELIVNYHSLLLNQGAVGKGWNHNFENRLLFSSNGDITVQWSSNRMNIFKKEKENTYISTDLDVKNDKLIKNQDGTYTYTTKDEQTYRFGKDGKMTQHINREGFQLNFSYEANGYLYKIVEPITGQYLQFKYNSKGLVDAVSDKIGRKVSFTYDSKNQLIGITDLNGKKLTYSYNSQGRLLSSKDTEGKLIFSNTYDDKGRVIKQDDGVTSNKITTFTYDEASQPGKLITIVKDRTGHSRELTHDKNYQLIKEKDQNGKITSFKYDNDGNKISETDALGRTTNYEYDSRSNLITVVDPSGHKTNMTYDKQDNVTTIKNAQGKKTINTYDSHHRLLSTTDNMGKKTTFTYNGNGLLSYVISPNKGKTTYIYTKGWLSKITDATGIVTSFGYDEIGRVISQQKGSQKPNKIVYDQKDQVIKVIDPLGNSLSYTYDSLGNKVSTTDAKGNVTKYQYNANSKLSAQIDANGKKTQFAYDGEDRLVITVDSNGNTTTFTYDAKGQLIKTSDPLGNVTTNQYDAVGNIIGTLDANGKKVETIKYDLRNNPVSVMNALGYKTTYVYDSLNRQTQLKDALNQSTLFQYDGLDHLIASIDPTGNKSSQEYDAAGNRISQTDANGNVTKFTFDKSGKLISLKNAAGNVMYHEYNESGQLVKTTNGRGQVKAYTYDAAGNITKIKDPSGTISYTYDKNGNGTSVKDSLGTISYSYDKLNRLVKYTDVFGNIIQYQYDSVGNLVKLIYPGNKAVQYSYDKANQLIQVLDWKKRKTTYVYDKNGRLIKSIRPNGSIETNTYNVAGQLMQVKDITKTNRVISNYSYTYDKVGNITQEKSATTGYQMSYSANNQLMMRKDLNTKGSIINQHEYSYDKTGNILSTKLDKSSQTMTYLTDNRLGKYNSQAFSYDKDGNMTKGLLKGKAQSFSYDARNRLISTKELSYQYDANNNRVAVTQNKNTTRYIVNPNAPLSQVLVETDAKGKPKRYHIYGLGLIGSEGSDGQYFSYHYDRRGSTIAVSAINGTVTDTFEYSPYGEVKHTKGKIMTPFLYNGRDGVMTDANGLYYMRARYYQPELKRFINQDIQLGTIDNGLGLNRYAYVQGNPISYIDPEGEWAWIVAGAVIGAAWNSGAQIVNNTLDADPDTKWYSNIGSAAAGGAVSGALASSGVGLIGSSVAGAAVQTTIKTAFETKREERDAWGITEDFAGNTVGNYVGGKFAEHAAIGILGKASTEKWVKPTKWSTSFKGGYAKRSLYLEGSMGTGAQLVYGLSGRYGELFADKVAKGITSFIK